MRHHGILCIVPFLLFAGLPAVAQDDVAQDGGEVAVESRELRLNGAAVHYLEAGRGPTVLLLHGGRYSSATWRELGTVELLARQGFRALALDLPGFGASAPTETPADRFLAALLPLLVDRPVVVVTPSMSGRFSFPLLVRRPDYVSGFVALAPVEIASHLDKIRDSGIPALVLWGENDEVILPKESRALADALPNSRRVELEDAGHACYLEQPAVFHRELLGFLRSLDGAP